MTQKISSVNIEATTLSSFTGPTITNIAVANSTYVLLDDTAVSNAGGYAVITGSNFTSGAQVLFGSTPATAVTFVNSTTLNVQVPELTAGSYVTYVQNADGSTAIRLNGITSSPIPVWATGSTLTTQNDGVAISIQLSATSDSSVVYSVADGSSLPSGTTLSSSGLFSGTISGLSGDTTYNFSVNAIDAENQETLRSFSVTVASGDPLFKDTVLLLNGETSNNTWITDASTNKFALTVNGDTRPMAFSPYETVWSNYFDGTGDDLTIPTNSAFTYGTGDFTIEMWVYIAANPAIDYAYIYGQGPLNSTAMSLYIQSGKFNVWSGSTIISSATSYLLNKWYHVVISRSGTSLRLFLDGVQDGSATNTSNVASGSTYGISVGRWAEIGDNRYFTGYISNVRVVKGTAVYTANFTPPTSPLTAIANTSLLTCQSNRLIDNSTNNFTITKNGDVTVSNFGPFVETDLVTGSGYFDGTGDYLNAGTTQLWTPANSFTVESWFYITSFGGNTRGFFAKDAGTSGSSRGISIYVNTNGSVTVFYSSSGSDELSATSVSGLVTVNQWYYFAFVKNGSSCKLYLNGSSVLSFTSATIACPASPSNLIGAFTNGSSALNMLGYMSDFRLVSNTAVYTSNFTPPTTPLTAIANTSLLTLQSRIGENNNRFIDTSGINSIITRNGNASQGTFSPFQIGGWSNYFDGTGDSLGVPANAAFSFGTGDFTYDAWIYPTSDGTGGTFRFIMGAGGSGQQDQLLINSAGNRTIFYFDGTTSFTTSNQFTLNSWNHVAVSRNSGTLRVFIDGVQGASGASSTNITIGATNIFYIGNRSGGAESPQQAFIGYISNVRVVKGTGLYTANFTPPTLPLTAIANTSILTCADSGFIDDSPNNFAITRNGDTLVEAFSPFKVYSMTANTLSVFFDGTGDYLSIADSANLQLGSGNFTAEGWFNSLSTKTGSVVAFYTKGVNTTGGIIFGVSSDHVFCRHTGTTDLIFNSGTGTNSNQWIHVAWVRNGNQLTIYRNGANVASASVSFNQNDTSVAQIGSVASVASATNRFGGYASNFRIVKGTAVYTSNFTPPTSPLTAITNTNLLLCSSNTLIDLSTANTGGTPFLVTATGTPRPTMVNPMGFTTSNVTGTSAEYSITSEGASGYYDGTGDYLAIADKADLRPGTSNFTLEAWIYRNAAGVAHTIYAKGGTSTGILFQVTATNILRFTHTTTNIDSTVTVPAKSWVHVAVIRGGTSTNQTKLYINGVTVAQGTVSTDFTQTEEARVGTNRAAGENFNGYISSLRFIKGQALYTSSFITSLSPSTQTPNTTLLINNTNGAIINYSRKSNLETIGDVKIRNNVVKYGNTSMYFDGTDDALIMPYSPIFNLGTGQFTIECWVNFSTLSGNRLIFDTYTAASAGGGYQFYWRGTGTSIVFYANGVVVAQSSFTSHAIDTWYHVATTRDSSGIVRVFVDGVMYAYASYTATIDIATTARPGVGIQVATSTNDFHGYIDDLRITKGFSRYSSNTSFTPPTIAFSRR